MQRTTLAAALEDERKAQRIPLTHLAARIEMSAGRVREVLNGATPNPRFETVLKLLKGLGKDLAWLGACLGPPGPLNDRRPQRPPSATTAARG